MSRESVEQSANEGQSEIPADVRFLFDRLPSPVHFFRDDTRNIWANRAMDDFLGYGRGGVAALLTTDIYFEYAKDVHNELVQDFLELGHAQGRIMVGRSDGSLVSVAFNSTANVLPGIHLTTWWPELSAVLNHDHFDWPSVSISSRPRLTAREFQVANLIADGAGNTQISRALEIAEATVQQYADSVREKVGAANRSEMVSGAIGSRLIDGKTPRQFLMVAKAVEGQSRTGLVRVTYLSASAVARDPRLASLVGKPFQMRAYSEAERDSDHPKAEESSVPIVWVDRSGVGHFSGSEVDGTLRSFHAHIRDFGLGCTLFRIAPTVLPE